MALVALIVNGKCSDNPVTPPIVTIGNLATSKPDDVISLFSSPSQLVLRKEAHPKLAKSSDSSCRFLGPLDGVLGQEFTAAIELLHQSAVNELDRVRLLAAASSFVKLSAEYDVYLTAEELRRVDIGDYWVVPTEDSSRVVRHMEQVPNMIIVMMAPILTPNSDFRSVTPIFAFDMSGTNHFSRLYKQLLDQLRKH